MVKAILAIMGILALYAGSVYFIYVLSGERAFWPALIMGAGVTLYFSCLPLMLFDFFCYIWNGTEGKPIKSKKQKIRRLLIPLLVWALIATGLMFVGCHPLIAILLPPVLAGPYLGASAKAAQGNSHSDDDFPTPMDLI